MICEQCKGKGEVVIRSSMGFNLVAKCGICNGTGKVGEPGVCPTCNGAKTIPYAIDKEHPNVRIQVNCPDCNPAVIIRQ